MTIQHPKDLASFLQDLLPTFHVEERRPVDLSTDSVCIRVQTGPADMSVGFIVVPSDGSQGTRGVAILAARSPFMIEVSDFSSRVELRTLVRDVFLRHVARREEPVRPLRYSLRFISPDGDTGRRMRTDNVSGEAWGYVAAFLGGHAESWRTEAGLELLFLEDGALRKLARNDLASEIAGFAIVGPCVIVTDHEHPRVVALGRGGQR